jgi:hypothetical protein
LIQPTRSPTYESPLESQHFQAGHKATHTSFLKIATTYMNQKGEEDEYSYELLFDLIAIYDHTLDASESGKLVVCLDASL